MIDQLPPEIFSRILEIAVDAWGIGFLPPVCLVSSVFHDIVLSSPRLWGIFNIRKQSSTSLLNFQLAKAKAADLSITVSRDGGERFCGHKGLRPFWRTLSSLAPNWVRGEVSTRTLTANDTTWTDFSRLQTLALRCHYHQAIVLPPREFFTSGPRSLKLHSFTAIGLPEEWVMGPLHRGITFFQLSRLVNTQASILLRYLSLVPNLHTLNLHSISLPLLSTSTSNSTVALPSLSNLELVNFTHFAALLLDIRAVALKVLTIRNSTGQMSSVFAQWSQIDFLPSNLQSLELHHCLSPNDMPFLIRWLRRLPALLRLTITHDYEIGDADPQTSSLDTDLYKALSSPSGADSGWLCPSLIHLHLDVDLSWADILPIARARGGAVVRSTDSPSGLRSMHAVFCTSATAEEIAEFRSFFLNADDVQCLCVSCVMGL
ncbi:hypothetical protein C8J57DRAFT_1501760 [Mycena rebaudengoi]|nr:hypothetical protein C8J57DRAFT_1501760 [Mycena rebaudengoi]